MSNILAGDTGMMMEAGGDEENVDPLRSVLVDLGLLKIVNQPLSWRIIVPRSDSMKFGVEVIDQDTIYLHVTGLKSGALMIESLKLSEADSKLTESVDGGKIVIALKPVKAIRLEKAVVEYFVEKVGEKEEKTWKVFVFSYQEEVGSLLIAAEEF
jgi:hypothetical protein